MKKFKVSTRDLVQTAANEVNEAWSPGFDNETAARMFLENKQYTIVEKLGNGAYASVFTAIDNTGEEFTVKVTRSEERQEHAITEKNILEEIKGGPNFPSFVSFEYDPLYYMSILKTEPTKEFH